MKYSPHFTIWIPWGFWRKKTRKKGVVTATSCSPPLPVFHYVCWSHQAVGAPSQKNETNPQSEAMIKFVCFPRFPGKYIRSCDDSPILAIVDVVWSANDVTLFFLIMTSQLPALLVALLVQTVLASQAKTCCWNTHQAQFLGCPTPNFGYSCSWLV